MEQAKHFTGFVLQKQWRDQAQGLTLQLWVASDDGPVHVTMTGQEAVMFVSRRNAASADACVQTRPSHRRVLPLQNLRGDAVDAWYYRKQRDLMQARRELREHGIFPEEADINPVERFLMERFVTDALEVVGTAEWRGGVWEMLNPRIRTAEYRPRLHAMSIDIETDGFTGPLLSIAGVAGEEERFFLVENADEAATLRAFLGWVAEVDPDLLLGWNVVDFDLDYLARLARRLGVPFSLGRGGRAAEVLEPRSVEQARTARVPGRVVLDGIATLRSATLHFESYALDDVAHELLGRGKAMHASTDAAEEIRRMAREAPEELKHYNLEDCRLVLAIFERARLIDFAIERQRLTGLPLDRQGGSVAAFDQLYLPRLHRAGYVAPSVGDRQSRLGSPGGYVMDSVPGLYRNIIVLDFKSLYPSIIRTFLVDPLGLAQPGEDPVDGFEGARFLREGHILPELVRALWEARDRAKSQKNEALSRAIKIMMNSFYGVLGTPGCRFFDHRLVSSITLRGHEVIQLSRQFLEGQGYQVIYGDTDSLFVALDPEASPQSCQRQGQALAQQLTAYFRERLMREQRLSSQLELEYECHFHRFLMPTMRGSEVGTKKRYAGSVVDPSGKTSVVFKGMEAVRTDWTPLARSFQRELFRRVFSDGSYHEYIVQISADLLAGKLDEQLIYRKRLRRELAEYQKNVPPHVQAARKLPHPTRRVEYVITVNGPEPVGYVQSALDYDHYLQRQLAPAADSLLTELGESFDGIAGRQLSLDWT